MHNLNAQETCSAPQQKHAYRPKRNMSHALAEDMPSLSAVTALVLNDLLPKFQKMLELRDGVSMNVGIASEIDSETASTVLKRFSRSRLGQTV